MSSHVGPAVLRRLPRPAAVRLTAVLAAGVALLFLAPRAALAHAVLLRSDPAQNARLPAGPGRVDLFFSEPLSHAFSTVQVRDPNGVRVDKVDVRFTADPTEMTDDLGQLGPDFYTVEWTTVSAVDGHRLEGTYPFIVLNPDGSTPAGTLPPVTSGGSGGPTVPDTVLRWLLLLGLAATTGAFALPLLVLFPAAAGLDAPDGERARAFALRLFGLAAPGAAVLTLAVNPLALLRQGAQAGGLQRLGTYLSGRTGELGLLRELAVGMALALALVACRRRRRPVLAAGAGRLLLWGGLGASVVALATLSLTSHAAARAGAGWSVPSDFLHLTGVAFWLGSLLQLPVLLRMNSGLAFRPRYAFLGRALARFSTLAWVSIAAVLLSGLFNASVEVASLSNFGGTDYGDILIDKLLIVAPLLLLGLINAVVLSPRIQRATGNTGNTGQLKDVDGTNATLAAARAARMLSVSAATEALLGIAVLAATGALVFAVPSRDVAAQKRERFQPSAATSSVYRNTVPAGDLQAQLTVTPNRTGENDFQVTLNGPDAADALRVQLRFQPVSQPLGGSSVDLMPVAGSPGQFDAQAANLSFVGRWQLTVNVRRTGHDDVNGLFTVEVPDVTGATTITSPTAGLGIWTFPGHGITANQALGVAFVVAGVLLLRVRRPLRNRHRLLGLAGSTSMLLAFLAGFGLFFATHSHGGSVQALENPVPADQRSIDDGRTLFVNDCAKCHGDTGHGDGPLSPGLNPRPVDLTVHVGLHPQYQLYDWITNGIPPTAMPAWKAQLTDQQRWDLVNYLETLQAP